ncbi:WhiB family transcriptional regulator [Streptomyces yaizuensis]|uniref:4Fe-4S Wbl-type domain-containing protein n=1 Tax=Streptomyces yaizuensis TaxID=2989713 RepID=A0AA86MG39_9ACTN|nr:WhiB family transcriptional regulator [Streptomyces sp. YSPA8]BDT39474.1 hypothetical protein SYYSPA8_36780 [Streptomyces sp. YSPA8]
MINDSITDILCDGRVSTERQALHHAISALPRSYRLPCWIEPDRWFSTVGAVRLSAIRDCQDCPVREHCLATALAEGETWGVWGGRAFPITQPKPKRKPPAQRTRYRAKAHTLSKA